jgi:hypothetical protein
VSRAAENFCVGGGAIYAFSPFHGWKDGFLTGSEKVWQRADFFDTLTGTSRIPVRFFFIRDAFSQPWRKIF